MNLSETNEWQHKDDSGLVFPWYVKPFLDKLNTWDLKDKVVFEYGAGASTLWWASRCKKVISVDNDPLYYSIVCAEIDQRGINNALVSLKQDPAEYVDHIGSRKYDIVIVDGLSRDACILRAINQTKVLIVDNWEQEKVYFASKEVKGLLSETKTEIYHQPSHPDWKTAVFYL